MEKTDILKIFICIHFFDCAGSQLRLTDLQLRRVGSSFLCVRSVTQLCPAPRRSPGQGPSYQAENLMSVRPMSSLVGLLQSPGLESVCVCVCVCVRAHLFILG